MTYERSSWYRGGLLAALVDHPYTCGRVPLFPFFVCSGTHWHSIAGILTVAAGNIAKPLHIFDKDDTYQKINVFEKHLMHKVHLDHNHDQDHDHDLTHAELAAKNQLRTFPKFPAATVSDTFIPTT